MGLLYNYTYLNANKYLEKFKTALGDPYLDRATLTKLLKIYDRNHRFKDFIVTNEKGVKCLYNKRMLNDILGVNEIGEMTISPRMNRALRELEGYLRYFYEQDIRNSEPQQYDEPDFSNDEEDMEKVSDMLIRQGNLNEKKVRKIHLTEAQVKKILIHEGIMPDPEYDAVKISYSIIPPQGEDDETMYYVYGFETLQGEFYTDYNEECDEGDLKYYFGQEVAEKMVNGEGEKRSNGQNEYLYLDMDTEKSIDTTDVEAMNAYAKRLYGTTYDFRVAGYLLTDGSLLDFSGGPAASGTRGVDHHNLSINGVDLYGFIALGNIRMTPETPGFELCKLPTKAQRDKLQRFIEYLGYRRNYMAVDIVNENGDTIFSREYEKPEFGEIFKDIDAHAGRKMAAPVYRSELSQFMENRKGKKIRITESQFKELKENLGRQYFVEPEKVEIVKKYLDDNFVRGKMPIMGEDGYPSTVCVVGMKMADGSVGKNMTAVQLFYLLQDKFSKIYSDPKQRDLFLKQIIPDWFYKKIKNGLLSKNKY